jgi:hypothetical protein
MVFSNGNTTVCQFAVGVTTDGSRPLFTSPSIRFIQHAVMYLGTFHQLPDITQQFSVSSTPTNPWRFIASIVKIVGAGSLRMRAESTSISQWVRIVDVGPTSAITGNTIVANTGV